MGGDAWRAETGLLLCDLLTIYNSRMGKNVVLAERLRALRKARGWTQHDLSRASGLTRSHISRLEQGDIQLPASERLRQLANALDTTLDDLLEAAGYRDPLPLDGDLPDLASYLRRKYGLDDPGVLESLQALSGALAPGRPAAPRPPEAGDLLDSF